MADRPEVFLASRNRKKVEEMQRILAQHVPGVRVLGLDEVTPYDEPAETEPTFEGNAMIKALAAVRATGLPSLADDSGLCVEALNGMPGVLSARWAGLTDADAATKDQANNELLLAQMADVPDDRRGAEFRCAVVLAVPGSSRHDEPGTRTVTGSMRGRIIREVRGSGGFGYDVLFCAAGHDVTTAEMEPADKDAISHRGEALRAVAPVVAETLR